jgi:precorrin-2/cobalt-factor-2 C20-methyltransferase
MYGQKTNMTLAAPSTVTEGTLYGVSIGPGDPELITLKALRLLQSAPVVAFPASRQIGEPGLAERIITPWLSNAQIQLPLSFAFSQDPHQLKVAWQKAAQQVWHYLAQGQDVAFACEGDISFYSTFSYLAQSLQQQYPQAQIQTTPGICSPMAAAAILGIPLTQQHQKLAILPTLYSLEALETVLGWADVVVLLKVNTVYAQVWPILQQYGLLERSWVVEHATRADQIVYANLSQLPNLTLSYFSLLIIQVNPCVFN